MSSIRRVIASALCLVTLSMAFAPGAIASETRRGFGIVMGRDIRQATLRIEGRTFLVTPSTSFSGLDGEPLAFETMPIFDVHQGLFSLQDATKVEYTATRTRGGQWVLQSVQIIDRVPE